jgi:hypothetical protein
LQTSGGAIYTIPPSTQWTAWTYLQEWAAEEIHPHPPTIGFLTFFNVSHFCPVVTLVHFHMYNRMSTCYYWVNECYAASHWLGKGFLLQLSQEHKRGIVPFHDAN